VLANSTEYQHAIDEDAKATGWYKLMSNFQADVVQMGMVPL